MVVIVDYGMGNIYSVSSAFKYLGVETILSDNPEVIGQAKRLILPGVGSFRRAMENLKGSGLIDVLNTAILDQKVPILGICLGMQLMGVSSVEDGVTEGLAYIDCPIEKISSKENSKLKIPHVGFNNVTTIADSILFRGLPKSVDFYFTHSFRMVQKKQNFVSGTCFYGDEFVASFEKENIFGTQFHPEKSQSNGLVLLKNFMEWESIGG
jgi:glutamine amidotransferase